MLRRASQRTALALLQVQERRRLAHGVEPIDVHQNSLTCVVRLPPALALAVHDVVRTMPGVERHYAYPAEDLHLTVLGLGDATALEDVESVLRRTPPFAVRLHGLRQSAYSVYVRALDDSGELQALRRRLMAVTGVEPSWPRRRLGFVNVVRYFDTEAAALGPAVRELGRRPFGSLEVTVAEVVRTDRVLSSAGTELLSRTPLGRPS